MELRCLEYPFDWAYLNRKKKFIKRKIEENTSNFVEKKIAILGGSTTFELKLMLELFLLKEGIKPIFYESEYNKYYEEAMFSEELINFNPDIVYIHTTIKNIIQFPLMSNSPDEVKYLLEQEKNKLENIWKTLSKKISCIIIQNNFEFPQYRFTGNSAATLYNGNVYFISELNNFLIKSVGKYKNIYINDIQYLSSDLGLSRWYDNFLWDSYKYAMSFEGIVYLAHSVSNIIKAIYGKNKKALVLDLDNTLWGGIIGDDGITGIKIGKETAIGEAYSVFQQYLKSLKEAGIILAIASKNNLENVELAFKHPSMILKKEDFSSIKANWNPKSQNIIQSAKEINIGIDTFVFLDDNPAERELVKIDLKEVAVPDIGNEVQNYINHIDKNGYFELLSISEEDLKRSSYYLDNIKRETELSLHHNYEEYLKSLEMIGDIQEAKNIYLERIYQLVNKTNQFNLTTKRYTSEEITEISKDVDKILLYGRLKDKFGDNGLVSIIIANKSNQNLDIELWIMSCRVLKRDFEKAMLDILVEKAKEKKLKNIIGHYIPTTKNKMVEDHYQLMGFSKIGEHKLETTWCLPVEKYINQNINIELKEYE
ncbi:hypothetical protein IX293_002160 [Fusobacterium necrophorum]|nr:HAD-IIIC family phosphatase [Fusobacterium necrophorum]MBR8823885.1 hypothetical protein [Fusobacterium necrophorum]